VLARVRRGERVPAFDTERRDKERRPIEVSLSLSPIRDEAGHVVGISAIARDIAERRRLEAEREWLLLAERAARAEAEAAVRAHDELLAIVTHDLKNPLAAIQGYAQLLRRKARRGDTVGLETFGETLSQIEDGARRMGTMLGELLDSARLQAGRALELDPQPADLAELARRVAGWQTGTGVAPQIRVDATEAVECSCDQARLERAVDNLIGNAVKYSPDGGQILVRVERDGAWAVLSIRDHGIGIPVADKPRLFERFHRCANALGRFSGTGIGLASVRQIVEAHGGTIAVESEEGEGTTFTVRIPLRAPRRCEPGRGPDRQQMRTSGTDGP
jgi:signal transduction histidine kinase